MVFGIEKLGALVPKANMFDGVRAISFFSKIAIKYYRISLLPFIEEMNFAKRY